jgi:large subunit ribosomal protein L4e
MATARPVVSVFEVSTEKTAAPVAGKKPICLPQVFSAPLRADLVRTVHMNMNKNKRQAMGVKFEAGYDTAAISWGTGRAVARIPRVPGGGTHRSGQGAFGNMCRGGGMFNPNKTWRRIHRKTNVTQKRHALAASLAATAVPALVMARGHRVDEVPELPLVISDAANKITKTKDAVKALRNLGCGADLDRVLASRKVRAGRGKCRNRRYVMRKGPILVHAMEKEEMGEASLVKSFRNIPGLDIAHVDRLNLLQLAPGGSIGRFAVFTESAIARLRKLFGTVKGGSTEKKGFTLMRPQMKNTDITRIINSSEIQSVLTPKKEPIRHVQTRKNPLKSKSVLGRLCPYAPTERKRNALKHKKNTRVSTASKGKVSKNAIKRKAHKPAKKAYFKNLIGAYAPKKVEAEEEK